MPEGDTVWNTARKLDVLVGEELTKSDFRVPQLAATDLSGYTVVSSGSRGKHLLLRLERGGDQRTLHSHLRMEGTWRTFRPGERWSGRPAFLIRVALTTTAWVAVGYHLHEVALWPTAQEKQLDHLGPDLLGEDWDPQEAARRIREKPDRTIGEALLDQRNLAGVGNLYKGETLFLSGINPWTPVGELEDVEKIVTLAQKLVANNKGRWTQTTTGSLRRGETSYVYGRKAMPCRRCGTAIRKKDLDERVTYWCPVCQAAGLP
jgi:endonuclease-8